MKKLNLRKKIIIVAVCVVIVTVFVLGYKVGSKNQIKEETTKYSSIFGDLKLPDELKKRVVIKELINARLEDIMDLYTAECIYSGKTEVENYIGNPIPFWFTRNSIEIYYNGVVRVGYDMKDVEVKNIGRKIYITLPKEQTVVNFLDIENTKCVERNNILNPIEWEQYHQLMLEAEEKGLEEAETKQVYSEARRNFILNIENALESFEEEGYEIEIL